MQDPFFAMKYMFLGSRRALNWFKRKPENDLINTNEFVRKVALNTINKRIDLINTGQRNPAQNPDFLDIYLKDYLKDLNLPND